MKKLILSSLILATMGITIIGCNKEEIPVINKKEVSNTTQDYEYSNNDYIIYGKKFKSNQNRENSNLTLGELHNEILENAFQNFNFNSDNYRIELERNFLNTFGEGFMDFYPENGNFKDVINEELSEQAIEFINESTIIYTNLVNYESFNNEIESLILRIENSNLCNKDKEATLIYMDVFKNSTFFWLDPNKGGSGVGHSILLNIYETENDFAAVSPAVADALGAAGSFIVGAFVTAATGGTGIGIFYGVAGASAWASGTNALF